MPFLLFSLAVVVIVPIIIVVATVLVVAVTVIVVTAADSFSLFLFPKLLLIFCLGISDSCAIFFFFLAGFKNFGFIFIQKKSPPSEEQKR